MIPPNNWKFLCGMGMLLLSCGQKKVNGPVSIPQKKVDISVKQLLYVSPEELIDYNSLSDYRDFKFCGSIVDKTAYLWCTQNPGYKPYNVDFVFRNNRIYWVVNGRKIASEYRINTIANCFTKGYSADQHPLFEQFGYKAMNGDLYMYDEDSSLYRYDANGACVVPVRIKSVQKKFKVKIKFHKEVSLFGPEYYRLYKVDDIQCAEKNFAFVEETYVFIRDDSQVGPNHEDNDKLYFDGYLSFMTAQERKEYGYDSFIFTLQ